MMWAKLKVVVGVTAAVVVGGSVAGLIAAVAAAPDPGAGSRPRETYRLKLDAGPTGSQAEVKPSVVNDEGLTVVEISEPGALTQSDTKYVLTKDVEAPATAFTIGGGVRVVIFDLGGHVVTYNTEKKEGVPGKPYSECVHGVSIGGRGVENIVIRNGTIVQGAGGNAGSHAIRINGGRAIEIANTMSRVHGPSCSNLLTNWAGPDGRVHDNYMENRSRTIARGLFAPTGITLGATQKNWEVYNNTIIGGHQAVAVWASGLRDHRTDYEIHHNFLSPRRVHGLKVPEGVLCFSSSGNHIYENEISTDDSRGINPQGGTHHIHHNFVSCRYSSKATEGNYVENRCYGYWERNCNGNRVHDNVFITNNEVIGDRTSNSIGLFATTTGDDVRLKSGEFANNRIICFHRNPDVPVEGVHIKRSDGDVVVSGNEILAGSGGIRVFQLSDGVQLRGNVFLRTASTPRETQVFGGDCIGKCRLKDNREVMLGLGDEAPAAPTGLQVIHRFEAVELRWTRNPEKDVIGYHVYCDGRKINSYPVGGRFYVHLGVKPGQIHTYRISAIDLADRESAKSAPLVVVQK